MFFSTNLGIAAIVNYFHATFDIAEIELTTCKDYK